MPRFIKKTSKKAGLSPGTFVHIGPRPKSEDYDDYVFIIFNMLFYDNDNTHITSE